MASCFSKFFLFVLNFTIFGVGVAVIALAAIILSQTGDFQNLIGDGTVTLPLIFLFVGIGVTLLGFFGCFGALRESPCLLYTYASIVLLLFIAQVVVVIYGIVQQDEIKAFISDSMVDTFEKYGSPNDPTLSATLDKTQNSLKCCGVNNYTDWYTGVINSEGDLGGDVPVGCCRINSTTCNLNIEGVPEETVSSRIYVKGCYTLFIETFQDKALWLIIGGSILAIIQLACITIACGLGRNSRPSAVY